MVGFAHSLGPKDVDRYVWGVDLRGGCQLLRVPPLHNHDRRASDFLGINESDNPILQISRTLQKRPDEA